MNQLINKIICWWKGHQWKWSYDDKDYCQFAAGDCLRCGKLGAGIVPKEPTYPYKEISESITKKGFEL